jgi:hypothetical protein
MIRLFFSVGLLLCVGGSAFAQQSGYLKGITQLGFLVEGLDQDTQRCGITRELIRDAIAYTISSSKLKFSDDDKKRPLIRVGVAALIQRQPVQCFSALSFDVVHAQDVQLDYADEPPRYIVMWLWHDTWLEVASPERHSGQVRGAVENATKKLVAAWYLANQP